MLRITFNFVLDHPASIQCQPIIIWLQRMLSYCYKLVANKAESELLLDFVLLAGEAWQGLHEEVRGTGRGW
jgi:hypothetical protein